MRKKTLLCLTLLALGGCADVANMAGYDSRTINLKAAEGYQQILGEAQSQNALDTRSPTAQRVHNIFNRMVPAANANNRTGVPFNWEMHVIRSDELNAWAMPGGKMAVYSGLVENLNLTDDELAAVIGHEMTHALREHSKAQVGQQLLTGIGMQLGGSLLAKNSSIDPQTLQTGGALLSEYGISKPFSRQHETEADIGGLMLMASAGYNPQAALSVWQKMAQAGSSGMPSFLSTHPSGADRIQVLQPRQRPRKCRTHARTASRHRGAAKQLGTAKPRRRHARRTVDAIAGQTLSGYKGKGRARTLPFFVIKRPFQ